jgi:hypothetical protein
VASQWLESHLRGSVSLPVRLWQAELACELSLSALALLRKHCGVCFSLTLAHTLEDGV